MKTIFNTVGAVAMAGLLAFSGSVPAEAQGLFSRHDRGWHDRDWHDRGDWRPRRHHHRGWRGNGGGAVAAGVLGFGLGAIVGGAIANDNRRGDRLIGPVYDYGPSYSAHVRACYARYRSYDARTDTFLGYDGYRHRCNL
ncbi:MULTISPECIES: BA14K family protein [unclassified Devosia]|uniref:BA14K family protein n=1 Tax=unclassified Devosia TaxID=196773 RepID=UPI000FDC2526|nr:MULTISPECIES: BA14K family protein [unclassified Devosia]